MRAGLGAFVLSLAAACSSGATSSPDASGGAGASGGVGGQAGTAGGGQAGTAAGGTGGQAGSTGGTGGQAGSTGGTGGQAGSTGGAGSTGARGGAGGQAGSTGGRDGGDDACAGLVGVTFRSLTEEECGRGADGAFLCHWTISFTASGFNWQHSDYAESGTYTCDGGMVTAAPRPIRGQYNATSQTLMWDGLVYTRQ